MIREPKRRIYLIMTLALLAGYGWLAYALHLYGENPVVEPGVCLFKAFTGIPCPSCGSTRSVEHLIMGDLKGALYWNPFGLIISVIMLVVPFWLVLDVITGKETFYHFYIKMENIFKIKWIAALSVLLVLANWIWNIVKGL